MEIKTRLLHWRAMFGPLGAVLTAIYAVLGVVTLIRDNSLSPAARARWDAYQLIPHWPVSWWIAVGLGVLLVAALEGSYRHDQKRARTVAQLEARPSEKYAILCDVQSELVALVMHPTVSTMDKIEFHTLGKNLWLDVENRLFAYLHEDERTKLTELYDEPTVWKADIDYSKDVLRALKNEIETWVKAERPRNPPP